MPFSAGVWSSPYNWTTEAASPPIEIAKLDGLMSDLATALTNCILRDGTGLPTSTVPFNSQRISGLGNASADTDALNRITADARYILTTLASQTITGNVTVSGTLTATALVGPLAAASITGSHTLPDGVLSTNVPLLNGANVFSVAQVVSFAGAGLIIRGTAAGSSNVGFIQFQDTNQVVKGYIGDVGSGDADVSIASVAGGLVFLANNASVLALSTAGVATTPNANAGEVGTAGAVSRSISASTNTAASDAGKGIRMTGGTGQTFTLDGDPPTDSVVLLVNSSGNSWTIAASGTLTFAGATGSRTLATGCMAAAYHSGSGSWNIAGQLS